MPIYEDREKSGLSRFRVDLSENHFAQMQF